ncbi:MAG: hypothetical protein HY812_17515 [Planctomycetes bacterium]|nr:hypothetical protein [Planctomycetota bacterium]
MRFALLFLFCAASLALPALILIPLFFIGPPPYAWSSAPQAIDTAFEDGSRAVVVVLADPEEADREAARRRQEASARAVRTTKSLYDFSYRIDEPARVHGRIIAVDSAVVEASAPSEEALARCLERIPAFLDQSGQNPGMRLFRNHLLVVVIGLLVYSLALAPLWARIGSRVATLRPEPGAPAVPPAEIEARLLSFADEGSPFRVFREGVEIVAEWRHADSTLAGLMRQAHVRLLHRVRMRVDPEGKIVRALDHAAAARWQVEAGVARVRVAWRWTMFRGISFASARSARCAGLAIRDGRVVLEQAGSYSFDLGELKGPLIAVTLESGYSWKPVVSFWRWFGG